LVTKAGAFGKENTLEKIVETLGGKKMGIGKLKL
jgi:hypothetical protein